MQLPSLAASLMALLLAGTSAGLVAADASTPRPAAPSLRKPTSSTSAVDAAGFIRRWLVLEPASVSGRLTKNDVERALSESAHDGPASALPHDGDATRIGDKTLRWHALDTVHHNFNLYHFAWALSRPTSNVLFWATTVVESPREVRDARLAICSNAASVWWLNEERVISLYNDRQSVIDDGVSRRLILRKGRNVIRVAIVNGGGATDFCARFLDGQDRSITGLTVRLVNP